MVSKITLLLLMSSALLSAQDTVVPPMTVGKVEENKFLINVSAGPSFRIAKTMDGMTAAEEDYLKELKSGFAYDISMYYFHDEIGYGLRYNSYASKGSFASDNLVDPSGESGAGVAADNIKINFYGVGGMFQDKGLFPSDIISFEVALGYIHYVNNTTILYDYKITGGNFGLSTSFVYQFGITEAISIGPSVAFTGGVLKKFEINGNGISRTIDLSDDATESLYRIDLSVSARFRF